MFKNSLFQKLLVGIFALAITLPLACSNDDDDKSPTGPGDTPQEKQFTMPSNIKEIGQFFDFSSGTVTEALSGYDEWNIAFENGQMAIGITLNFGTGGRAVNTGLTDFDAVSLDSVGEKEYVLDGPWGDPSAVAIDEWYTMPQMGVIESKKEVYIIAATEGTEVAYYKFQMLGYSDSKYTFKFARLPDGEAVSAEVSKGGNAHWVYFSFASKSTVPFEPSKGSWDLYFGPLAVKMGPSYRAVGKILPNVADGVMVATADSVALDDLKVADWSGSLEEVYMLPGWYEYNHDTKEYNIYLQSTLLKSTEGKYIGLQFLSYQSAGSSGYPTFKYIYDMK